MKTLYALIFVLLSSPAIADVLDITPTGTDDTTSAISTPAPVIDHAVDFDIDYIDEYNAGPVPAEPAKPTDVAEIQVAVGPDDSVVEDDHIAGIVSPAALKVEEPINVEVESSQDEGTGFDLE
jgi:hypothetical protein